MKKASLKAASVALFGAALSVMSGCGDSESQRKADAFELEDVAAYWAVRGKDREQNNYIHPVVRFRIKNSGTEEAGYIQAMAVFKRETFPDEPWGNDFLYSISDTPLAPDGRSEILTMRSDTNFVSKDAPEQMFQNEKWEKISGRSVPAGRPVELEARPVARGPEADWSPWRREVHRSGGGDETRLRKSLIIGCSTF